MAALNLGSLLQNFTTLMQNSAAAVQGSARQLIDFTTGSAVRAIMEANASIALWIQWLIVLLMQRQRAQTCSGGDLDTWMADYGVVRLPGVAASGVVTLSRFTLGAAATVVPGTTVITTDGTETFAIVVDTTNPLWNTLATAYVIPALTFSGNVPVQAQAAGVAGNVQAGTITLLGSSVPGVDTLTNALAFTNGVDPESDAALQARFPLFISSLSKATPAAVGYAVTTTQQGLTYSIAEDLDEAGAFAPGHFVVYVDNGTGSPTTALKSAVYTAIDAIRAVSVTFSVQSPVITLVTVSMTVTPAPGFLKAGLQGPIGTAVTAYIDSLPVGTALYYSKLAQVVWDATPGIGAITGLIVNSAQADITVPTKGVVKLSTVSVN